MEFKTTVRFEKSFKSLPGDIRQKFYKQLSFLLNNFKHPSLHCKKVQGYENVWEARVDYQYRFTFNIHTGFVILRVIGNHDDVLKNP